MADEGSKVWVKVGSHRARGELKKIVPNLGGSWGIFAEWPPRGEYYQVPAEYADRLGGISSLRVLRGTPGNGAQLFKYI